MHPLLILAQGSVEDGQDVSPPFSVCLTDREQKANIQKRRELVSPHDILLPDRFIRAVLDFQDDRAGLEGAERVPGSGRDVEGADRAAWRDLDALAADPRIIIKLLHHFPAKYNKSLRGLPMPVDRNHRTRLDRIQHPLRHICRRIAEIKIHPQARRRLRLLGKAI